MILASRSPRRAELLTAAGIPFEVLAIDVDETPMAGEDPKAYVTRLAIAKASQVAAVRPGELVLGADTTVVIDGLILGKPTDEAEATEMLRLRGRMHGVLKWRVVDSRACLCGRERGVVRADDKGRRISNRRAAARGSSGACIQGRHRFILGLRAHANVVGLPVFRKQYPQGEQPYET